MRTPLASPQGQSAVTHSSWGSKPSTTHQIALAIKPRLGLQSAFMSDLSYAHGACDVPLLGETIGANFRRTAERFAEREALVVRHQNYRATYRQLWDVVSQVARGLVALG